MTLISEAQFSITLAPVTVAYFHSSHLFVWVLKHVDFAHKRAFRRLFHLLLYDVSHESKS